MYTVLGIFDDSQCAEDCINELESKGFNPKDISIIMRNKAEGQELAQSTGANVAGSAATGIATGAVIGGIAGLVGAFILPGIGAFLIGGPIATALGLTGAAATTVSGAATGAVAGGILGALMGFGLPEHEAKEYEQSINAGGILVAVPAMDDKYDEVRRIFTSYDATNVRSLAMPQDRMQQRNATMISDREEAYEEKPSYAESTQSYATVGAKGGQTASDETAADVANEETQTRQRGPRTTSDPNAGLVMRLPGSTAEIAASQAASAPFSSWRKIPVSGTATGTVRLTLRGNARMPAWDPYLAKECRLGRFL